MYVNAKIAPAQHNSPLRGGDAVPAPSSRPPTEASLAVLSHHGQHRVMNQSAVERILVVTPSAPVQPLVTQLAQRDACPLQLVAPGAPVEAAITRRALVLLDADHIDLASLQAWHQRVTEEPTLTLAAFHLGSEDHAIELLATLPLQGVFYRHDAPALVDKGIEVLLGGELWMSRTLMTRLIALYRRQHLGGQRAINGLSRRELEIIGQLGVGASNPEIARQLVISEHTVKTHLYNIYRKLKVRTRDQARAWAHYHLPAGIPRQSTTSDEA